MLESLKNQSIFGLKNLLMTAIGIVVITIIFFTYGELKINASQFFALVGMILTMYTIYSCCINELIGDEE